MMLGPVISPQEILQQAKRRVEDAARRVSECESELNQAVENLALTHDQVTYWEEVVERTAGLQVPEPVPFR